MSGVVEDEQGLEAIERALDGEATVNDIIENLDQTMAYMFFQGGDAPRINHEQERVELDTHDMLSLYDSFRKGHHRVSRDTLFGKVFHAVENTSQKLAEYSPDWENGDRARGAAYAPATVSAATLSGVGLAAAGVLSGDPMNYVYATLSSVGVTVVTARRGWIIHEEEYLEGLSAEAGTYTISPTP